MVCSQSEAICLSDYELVSAAQVNELQQHIPGGEGVFDVVGGGVDEDSTLVPGSTLHPDVLMNVAQTFQLAVADHDG